MTSGVLAALVTATMGLPGHFGKPPRGRHGSCIGRHPERQRHTRPTQSIFLTLRTVTVGPNWACTNFLACPASLA